MRHYRLSPHDRYQWQLKKLRHLLLHAWNHSVFYRTYYQQHGIKKDDLSHLTARDLPTVNKNILMDHWDEVVTQPDLNFRDVANFAERSTNPKELYREKYIVLHTSGTSGEKGVFVYSAHDWNYMQGMALQQYHLFNKLVFYRKNRIAIVLATGGHYTGITVSTSKKPAFLYKDTEISILLPENQIVASLQQAQPDLILCYPSVLEKVLPYIKNNRLSIHPRSILLSGEKMPHTLFDDIQALFPHCIVLDSYILTEAFIVALKRDKLSLYQVLSNIVIVNTMDLSLHGHPQDIKQAITTNLQNYTFPLIAYKLDDCVTPGEYLAEDSLHSIKHIHGRVFEYLPIITNQGNKDSINPHLLNEFFINGVVRFQFCLADPQKIIIKYVADNNFDKTIRDDFKKILIGKSAEHAMQVEINKVTNIPCNSGGKIPLVVVPANLKMGQ
jgi:phenylacetate-CoA ligase